MIKYDFTKKEFESIIEECMFNEELTAILRMRIQNYSIVQMSMKLNTSERTISRRLKEIDKKIKKIL